MEMTITWTTLDAEEVPTSTLPLHSEHVVACVAITQSDFFLPCIFLQYIKDQWWWVGSTTEVSLVTGKACFYHCCLCES